MVFSRLYYLMKLQEAAIVWNLNLSCRICIWGPRHVSKFVLRTCQSPFMLYWAGPQRREGHRPPQGCLKPGSMDLHSVHCTFSGAGSKGPTRCTFLPHTGHFQKAEFGHGGEAFIKVLLWQTRTWVRPSEDLGPTACFISFRRGPFIKISGRMTFDDEHLKISCNH